MPRWTGKEKVAGQEAHSGKSPGFLEIGKVERKEYDRLKRKALNFEEQNNRFILVIPCDGDKGWCEMGERSALLYKYEVCEPLGYNVALMDDLDSFYIQYSIGRVRTRGFDAARERIKRAGLYKAEIIRDRCMIFELTKTYTEMEIERLVETERVRQAQMNAIVDVKVSDPVLHQRMMELAGRMHRICFRKMDRLSSTTNGQRMVEICDRMIMKYYNICMGVKLSPAEMVEDWREMLRHVQELLVELQIVSDLKLWKREICVTLGESIIEIKKRVEKHLNYATNKLEQSNGRNKAGRVKAMATGGAH